jgi:hypothetical protein
MPEPTSLARYGLNCDPFIPSIPVEDLWIPPGADLLSASLESLGSNDSVALLVGEPGLGKSKILADFAATVLHPAQLLEHEAVLDTPTTSEDADA